MHPLSLRRGPRAALALLGSTFVLLVAAAADVSRPEPAPSRGALLYDTHCIECHTAQVHWRDRQQARDWVTLKAEVVRWQAAARLGWREDEIDAVTDYLNGTIYRFAAPQEQAHRGLPGAR